MALLADQGLADNTVLIFTSDNGPHEEGGADPEYFNHDGKFRGLKRSTHEGGIRIPFIVGWPGHIKAGSQSDLPFAFYDLMPTFCEMAGIRDYQKRHQRQQPQVQLAGNVGLQVSKPDYFDGISILPTLTGKGKQQLHDHLYWEFHETDMLAVRQGKWKLVVKRGEPTLYDLDADPHEDNDLSAKHPDIVRQLVDKIYEDHTDSPLFRITLPSRTRW